MKTLVIQKSKWARGGKNGTSMLENESGNMCCLGFYGKANGAKELRYRWSPLDAISYGGIASPRNFPRLTVKCKWSTLSRENTKECSAMMNVNDNEWITDTIRQGRLRRLFAKIGWKLKFVK